MSHSVRNACLLAALLLIPASASAQDFGSSTVPASRFASEYTQSPDAQRSTQWWWGLEKEVNLRPGASYQEVKVSDLQKVIFFATVQPDRVDLRASLPQLLDIYKHHEDVSLRMMSIAALSAIGDEYAMAEVRRAVRKEESARLRRMTLSALKDHADEALAAK